MASKQSINNNSALQSPLLDDDGKDAASSSDEQQHVEITRSTKLYAFCASLNSCNLGYDIGVNTGAGPLTPIITLVNQRSTRIILRITKSICNGLYEQTV